MSCEYFAELVCPPAMFHSMPRFCRACRDLFSWLWVLLPSSPIGLRTDDSSDQSYISFFRYTDYTAFSGLHFTNQLTPGYNTRIELVTAMLLYLSIFMPAPPLRGVPRHPSTGHIGGEPPLLHTEDVCVTSSPAHLTLTPPDLHVLSILLQWTFDGRLLTAEYSSVVVVIRRSKAGEERERGTREKEAESERGKKGRKIALSSSSSRYFGSIFDICFVFQLLCC